MKSFIILKSLTIIFFSLCLGCHSMELSDVKDEGRRTTDNSNKQASVSEEQIQEREKLANEIKDEVTIGREMASKLYGTFGSYSKNKQVLDYINSIGKTVAAQGGRSELNFKFGILETDEINAFATPGGYVLLTKGVLKLVKNESELAGVIAHEIAHVNHKHMYKDIAPKKEASANQTINKFLSAGKAELSAALSKAVSAGMKKLLEEGLQPEKEYESDSTAVTYSLMTGYDPIDYVRFLERLEKSVGQSHVSKTHPPFKERINRLKKFVEENGMEDKMSANKTVLENRFNEVMKTL